MTMLNSMRIETAIQIERFTVGLSFSSFGKLAKNGWMSPVKIGERA
jgi:NADH/NAD ratio-sensing transcriptional regulator Rex